MSYLKDLKNKLQEAGKEIDEIQDLYNQKLWHNITEKIESIIKIIPDSLILEFYEKFLSEFQLKINLFSLARIIICIAQKIKDKQRSISLLQSVASSIDEKNIQVSIVLRLEISLVMLELKENSNAVKLDLEKAKQTISTINYQCENIVHSSFHKVESEYFKATEQPNEYYKSALLYLAFTPIESFSKLEQQRIAYDLGMSALLGDRVYNFGELLGHPIVNSLFNSQAEWLVKLLFSFNKGNVNQYKQTIKDYEKYFTKVINDNSSFLLEKMRLMGLMELVFTRLAGDRTITFEEIQKVTEVQDVEILLLKALSLKLIKAVIDEVTKSVYVSWVQPRVLDLEQINSLNEKIGLWLVKVQNTLQFLEKEGKLSIDEI